MISDIHGNAKSSPPSGGIAPIGSEQPSIMTWKLPSDAPSDSPGRPLLSSHQSSSLPSTPYQRSRNLSFHSRSPSPHGSTSPRSTHSESTHLPPSVRKPLGGCKYETAMAYFRRRMPYTLGGDLLPEEKGALKEQLGHDEEQNLTAAMMDIYDRLLPSAESDDRRQQLVRKLEKLFNDQWPGREIKVHVFGSSGNKLCSSDSDVDICITTTSKELEHVCLLAEVLARHGMERVVCVSHAKVPIVKIWDPELRLACDMNVNNTLALENTRMIRTYVEIDERVRPLAMIIKHWTKRRVLNDAALGGTLSSYTWICLIINFLQTRNPPILPSLQARPHEKKVTPDGLVCSFDDDLKSLACYGQKNKESLGELLFQFFRYYGHELNYERNVISVREGNVVSKEAKGWHLLQNNRLCVEEPFNTSRNLGNTADDTSFRGVHLELRRAFKAIVEGKLGDCCEQYEFPPEEERCFERPPPQPRPVLSTPTPSYRGGRGGGRGGRHSNHFGRGGFNNNRRPSHTTKPGGFRHGNGAPDISYQAQQAQYLLHDQLYQQIQILQAQEHELRMQLQNQALLTGRSPPMLIRQPFMQFPVPQQQESTGDENSRSRSGTTSHPPLNQSLRQNVYYNAGYLPFAVPGVQGTSTNPPSPSATNAIPELRRSPRRSSAANGSPKGSSRAHSQPARSLNSPTSQSFGPLYSISHPGGSPQRPKQRNGSVEGGQGDDENCFMPSSMPDGSPRSGYLDEHQQSELMGYYLASSPQSYQNSMLSPMSAPVGLALQQNGFFSFVANPQEYISMLRANEASMSSSDQSSTSGSLNGSSQRRSVSRPEGARDRGPLIVDGSVPLSDQRPSMADGVEHYTAMSHCTSNSDETNTDTPVSVSDSFSQDFQDNSSIEMDQSSFPRKPVATNDSSSSVNGVGGAHHVKPGLLSTRLQKLHLSNSENSADSSKTGPERPKAASYTEMAAKDVPRPKQPTVADKAPASGLSPVTESNGQMPNGKRQPNGVDHSEKVNGVNHKSKPKGRSGLAQQTSTTASDRKDRQADNHRKPNGVGPTGASAQPSGGWQVSKKRNRRSNKSPGGNRQGTNGGPEPLPADESLRKGG